MDAIVCLAKISGETKGILLCGSGYQMREAGWQLRAMEDCKSH